MKIIKTITYTDITTPLYPKMTLTLVKDEDGLRLVVENINTCFQTKITHSGKNEILGVLQEEYAEFPVKELKEMMNLVINY